MKKTRKTIMILATMCALLLFCPMLARAQVLLYPTNGPDSTSQDSACGMLTIYPPADDSYAVLAGLGRIGNLGEPQIGTDAATKDYVDQRFETLLTTIDSLSVIINYFQTEYDSGLDTTICINDGSGSHWFEYVNGRLTGYEKRPHHCDWY